MPKIDMAELAANYANDRRAVRKCAEKYGVSIQCVYNHMHAYGIKLRTGGDTTKGIHSNVKNPNWKGGTTVRKDKYILEYEAGKQKFQHRIVAEKMIGRKLRHGECVHHKNGDKSDNRPENLEVLRSHAEHMKLHCDPTEMSERGKKGCAKRWGTALKARKAGAA